MNDWKELNPNNLPPDILAGDYELQFIIENPYRDSWCKVTAKHLEEAKIYEHRPYYRYRRREPKPPKEVTQCQNCMCIVESDSKKCTFCGKDPHVRIPTHREIMTKWWLNGGMWVQVASYEDGVYWIFDKISDDDSNEFTGVKKEWFISLESADIPPESNNG